MSFELPQSLSCHAMHVPAEHHRLGSRWQHASQLQLCPPPSPILSIHPRFLRPVCQALHLPAHLPACLPHSYIHHSALPTPIQCYAHMPAWGGPPPPPLPLFASGQRPSAPSIGSFCEGPFSVEDSRLNTAHSHVSVLLVPASRPHKVPTAPGWLILCACHAPYRVLISRLTSP